MPIRSRLKWAAAILVFSGVVAATTVAHGEDQLRRHPLREWLATRRGDQTVRQPNSSTTDENLIYRIRSDGREREFLVHLPRGHSLDDPLPLILALHGGGGDMNYMARNDLYGLEASSDQSGFIVVFPNGTGPLPSGKLATWNAGNCCARARDQNVDDVDFLKAVVRRVEEVYKIDRRRVFAIGMSNGGMMAYRLACEAPDVFRGIMSVAGTDNTQACPTNAAVAVLHIHALNDDHVLFYGGRGPAFKKGDAVTEFTSVPDTISKWVKRNNAQPAAQRILNRPGAYCDLHGASSGGAPVQLCVTETGEHSWPGGHKPRGEAPSQAISANDVMWRFFSSLQ